MRHKRGIEMTKWQEFLAHCDSEARPYFEEAKLLARETGYQVGEAGRAKKGGPPAFAIRFYTPNQKPKQTFFSILAAPNKLLFCFDDLVQKRDFSERKKQELLGYLRNEGVCTGAEEVERVMDESALGIFECVLDAVAGELKLRPTSAESQRPEPRGGPGEGEAHRTLKEHICGNPLSVGVDLKGAKAETEKNLPSGDTIDVFFENRTSWIGVEVKSDQSGENDIRRGLYQCIKYRAVMEAVCAVRGMKKNIRILLALGGPFPQSLHREKTVLGIEVIDELTRG